MVATHSVAVIGAGSWGTALAKLLAEKGVPTVLWAREADPADPPRGPAEAVLQLTGRDLGDEPDHPPN